MFLLASRPARQIEDGSKTVRRFTLLLTLYLAINALSHAEELVLPQRENFSGVFVQTKRLRALSIPMVSHGEFSIVNGLGLIWRVTEPISHEIVVTHHAKNRSGSGQIANMLRAIIALDTEALAQIFDVETEGGGHGWSMTLTPRSRELRQAIKKVAISGRSEVESVIITEGSDDTTEIRFDRIEDIRASDLNLLKAQE